MLIKLICLAAEPLAFRENPMEKRTARLTLLIDPRKKAAFESLCAQEDVTPSQKVRQFIREYLQSEMGPDWMEKAEALVDKSQE